MNRCEVTCEPALQRMRDNAYEISKERDILENALREAVSALLQAQYRVGVLADSDWQASNERARVQKGLDVVTAALAAVGRP